VKRSLVVLHAAAAARSVWTDFIYLFI
jgi:hypothetical protein